jgi:hypothetical protein
MKNIAIAVIFALVFLSLNSSPALAFRQGVLFGDKELQQAQERVHRLHQDISLINLLNGLHLTRDQLTQILALAQKARQTREQLFSRQYRAALQEAKTAFTALRQEIQKGTPARGEVPAQARRINHRLKEMRLQSFQQMRQAMQSLEARLNHVLTPEQVQVVKDFTPCLIPPKDLRNPVRAGQATSHGGMLKRLQRLRSIPADKWQTHRDRIAQRVVHKISKKVKPLTEAEKQEEKSRFLALADRIRQMPEVDFEMEKDKLIEELAPKARIKELKAEIKARHPRRGKHRGSRLTRYFLNERIIPILEERLARGPVAVLP